MEKPSFISPNNEIMYVVGWPHLDIVTMCWTITEVISRVTSIKSCVHLHSISVHCPLSVASLMNSLHQLKADNARLEERLATLTTRKNQLLQVNARLATPMSCTNTSSTTAPNTTKQNTPSASSTTTVTSQGTLTPETRTTHSSEGPRGSISAGADGAPKAEGPQRGGESKAPSISEGKVPMSANAKPSSVSGGKETICIFLFMPIVSGLKLTKKERNWGKLFFAKH